MAWFSLLVAIALVAIGVEAMLLAKRGAPQTDRELDELVAGKYRPPLSEASRNYVRSNFLAQLFLYPQLLGIIFVAAGGAFALLAFKLWRAST